MKIRFRASSAPIDPVTAAAPVAPGAPTALAALALVLAPLPADALGGPGAGAGNPAAVAVHAAGAAGATGTAGAGESRPAAARTTGSEPKPFSACVDLADLPERWGAIAELFDVPGAAVAAVRGGEVFVATFGTRDPESGAPVTPDTRFYVASITKTYLATAVCRLADEGELSLDDRVADHLPRLDLPDDGLEETLTVRDLLCHRYGIDAPPVVLLDAYTGEITDDRFYHWLARGRVAGRTAYTNVHYTMLGRVVEAVTGEPWRDHLDRVLFTPAGLDRTTGYASEMYGGADAAFPSERSGDGFRRTRQRKTDRVMHAAGGLGTTAVDAARYLLLHLNDGIVDGTRVLRPETARAMRELRAKTAEPEGSVRVVEGYGLGWQVGHYGDHPLVVHGGGYVGTGAYFAALPEDGVAAVVLVNGGGLARGWGDVVCVDLLERLTGTAPAWDVYATYVEEAEKRKSGGAETAEASADAGAAGVGASALSRPIGLYTGFFRNEHLGTVAVTREDGRLRFALGDLDLAAEPGDGPDRVRLHPLGDPVPAELVIDPDGTVNTVRLDLPPLGPQDFVR